MMSSEKILAWHFSPENGKLANGDNRPIRPGETISVKPPIVICRNGLHGSKRIIDALSYAPGPLLWRVEISGDVEEQNDKVCGEHRRVLWGFDARDLLFAFARRCALDVIGNWNPPEIVTLFLSSGDPALRSAAWSVAWSAADSAALSVARSAADSAAWSAARSAAESVADSAALSAAWSVADYAAGSAAESAADYAAWSVAWSAADSAAKEKQNSKLEEMVLQYYQDNIKGK